MIDAWGSWIYPGDRTSGDDFMGDLARMGIIFESGGGRPTTTTLFPGELTTQARWRLVFKDWFAVRYLGGSCHSCGRHSCACSR